MLDVRALALAPVREHEDRLAVKQGNQVVLDVAGVVVKKCDAVLLRWTTSAWRREVMDVGVPLPAVLVLAGLDLDWVDRLVVQCQKKSLGSSEVTLVLFLRESRDGTTDVDLHASP